MLPTKQHNIFYRPDIDGLRAIAVLSVILFHINEILVPGGFVGVDIFFVISGFLISKNILKELERGIFSIFDFYRRRVKRIMPAMLTMLAVTVITAQTLILPEDAEKTAESALWSILSLSNVYFWLFQDTSYFAPASSEIPLLHLWSLGVEEQFYIFWPIILIAAYRPSRAKWFGIVAAISALGSFWLGEQLFKRDSLFVYYMLPTRAGELLLGALVALASQKQNANRTLRIAAFPMSMLGFLLVGTSMFLTSSAMPFPGFLAIPPTLGTALLIFSAHCGDNLISRLLSCKPLSLIGLISYSAYLWHWPLLAFYRYGYKDVGPLSGLVIFILTFLLAWLSYTLVERPARLSKASTRQIFLRHFIIPVSALSLLSMAAMKLDGYGFRWLSTSYRNQLTMMRRATPAHYDHDYVCERYRLTIADTQNERCIIGPAENTPPQAILWGDSNATHYVGMIGIFAKKEGFRFRHLAAGSCPPLLYGDLKPFAPSAKVEACLASRNIALEVIRSFKVVIIGAAWTYYQSKSSDFLDTFFKMATSLANEGKLVIIMGKAPVISSYDRRCHEKALSYPLLECTFTNVQLAEDIVKLNAKLREFAEKTTNVRYYDANQFLCPHTVCSAVDEQGKLIFYDASHLSMEGSWELGETIFKRDGVPSPFLQIAHWPFTQ